MSDGTDFEIGKKLPYIIGVIFFLSGFLFLLAVLGNGVTTNYYKSNYGTAAVTFEETIFNCITYEDPIILKQYQRIIDFEKFRNVNLSDCVPSSTRDRQAKITLYLDDELWLDKETNWFVRASYHKRYPVLVYTEDGLLPAELRMEVWRP